jgi:hypothetical protein
VRVDTSLDPPQKVFGNLRFTHTGVYADYLAHGLPVTMRTLAVHERAARLTRNLGRNVPSGSQLFGLLAAEDQNRILSNIVGRHDDNGEWVKHCRTWEPVIADPLQTGTNTGPQQRLHWLTIPVDSGRLGRTVTGRAEKLGNWVIGRDPDSDTSVAGYSELAREIVCALPDEFHLTAATPAQILWHHRHNALRGVFAHPLPRAGVGPHELPANVFGRWGFDEGANTERLRHWLRRWWPTRHSLVRIQEVDNDGDPVGPVSYQAMLAVDQYPKRGVRFPKAAYLRALDNVDTTAIVDWVQHLNLRTPDQALAANRRNAKNIKDQQRQRAAKRDDADAEDLANKLDGTLDYSSELNANPTERELDGTTVIAIGASNIAVVEDAVKQIRQELDSAAIAFSRRRGSHRLLWKAFNPGSETTSPLDQFRNPTTAHRWSRFMPFTSEECGNSTGSPLAVNQNTNRPRIILHDPEGAARRNHNTGLGVVGEPGSGKSNRAKLSAFELALRGAQIRVFDPGKHGEWQTAFGSFPGVQAIDPTRSDISLDPLVIFPYEEAAAKAGDHILPVIGVDPRSIMRAQFEIALRPDNRERNGIRRMRDLIEYLRAQPNPHDNELLLRLESAAASHYTQALFDPRREPYSTADSQVTIWLTRNLALPDADDIRAAMNGGLDLQPRQLAGMAMYGLLVDLEQQQLFDRRDHYGQLIFEECAELLAYPPGARAAHRVTTQGRKHATGIGLITQDFHHLARMGDKFITQKWLFRVTDETLAEQTLEWAGIDPGMYPDVVQSYVEDTSPANTALIGEDDEIGYVEPHRRGEGFVVDEFRRHARAKFFGAPTAGLAADLDSTPPLESAA